MTPHQLIVAYRASAQAEVDHAALSEYALGHHLCQAREATERKDEATAAHHRGQAVVMAKALKDQRLKIAWYREAIAAIDAQRAPPPFSSFAPVVPADADDYADSLGMRVGG